jgi:hypothetical protein
LALEILSKGVTSTGGKVSAAEQTRIRRQRKSRTYFQDVRAAETLEKLRRCDDIIRLGGLDAGRLRLVDKGRGAPSSLPRS